MRRSAG